MEKKSGVQNGSRSLPGTGGNQSSGDTFQPNLAMGGGSYKIPFDLPSGPGGFSPKLELNYNTGFGNGIFGLGWFLALPFIECKRNSPYSSGQAEEYSLAGAETLIPFDNQGSYIPAIQQKLQPFRFQNGFWTSMTPDLVELRFGASANSRLEGMVDGTPKVHSWLCDQMTFPGNRVISFNYDEVERQRYLRRISWSVFSLEFEYEAREDAFSLHTSGFELRTDRRCSRMTLHQSRLAPNTLMRTYDFGYESAEFTKTSLLNSFSLTGWRMVGGVATPTVMPPFQFGYTRLDVAGKKIQKFRSSVTPPPSLHEDSTVIDYRGSSLPGILRMNGLEATWWENRGNLTWGPPERIPFLPQSIHLGEENVRFADLTGNGTADLVLASTGGGSYYANDPDQGFSRRTNLPIAPGFDLNAEDTWLVDLDGDRAADLLCFRNGVPMAFFNKQGNSWEGPVVLPDLSLGALNARQPEVRFADMTGNGNPDLVVMTSRRITYYPFLGKGRWGNLKVMRDSPEFDLANSNTGVFLADVNGDGLTDLVLTTNQEVRVFLNGGGEFFSEPIVIPRTPRFHPQRFIIADMAGSGAAGFLWTAESSSSNPHEYWYLDLLNGIKPNLLNRIENGRGFHTGIEYGTSAQERTVDLEEGKRWAGYLPFVVHVVKKVTASDLITGATQSTTYRYHDGNFDGIAREYMGFGMVESFKEATTHEEAIWQKSYYHNRHQTTLDPAFIAAKGQPHRMEILDPSNGEVRQRDESTWQARPLPTANLSQNAWLTFQSLRKTLRFQNGDIYAEENTIFDVDAVGNTVIEHRKGTWEDAMGNPRIDQLVIENAYASHPVHGLTGIQCLIKKTSGDGKLLKHITFFFDGDPFLGLPFGEVENGFRSRQTELALTQQHLNDAYGGSEALVKDFFRKEVHPEFGTVYLHDTRRYRNDILGNTVETLDALGHRIRYEYDPERIHPVSQQHDNFPVRRFEFDPIVQQVTLMEDLNGHRITTDYDAIGNVLQVFGRAAAPGLPSEVYTYDYSQLPNKIVQKIRVNAADADPGWEKIKYLDGNGRVVQEKALTETGQYAVGKQELFSGSGKKIGELDAWFSNMPDFEAPPLGLAMSRTFYDFGGRVVREELYNNTTLRYQYLRNETWFFNAVDGAALELKPDHIPSRISRMDAWGRLVSIVERDTLGIWEQKREYDGLDQITAIFDPMGNISLKNVYDGWGNKILVESAEAGVIRSVFDGNNNLVLQTDADSRSVAYRYDSMGRLTETRHDSHAGPLQESYKYDTGTGANLVGRLASVAGPFWTVEYSYNLDGKLTLARWNRDGLPTPMEVRFAYNQQQDVTLVRYPDGTEVQYDYFSTGLLHRIPGYIENIEYGPTGKRTKILFANNLETHKSFTPGDYLLEELRTQNADGSIRLQHLRYKLDDIGQVLEIHDMANQIGKVRNNQTFEYDSHNRLVRATGRAPAGTYDFRYKYDPLGNLVFSGESFAELMDYGHHVGDLAHPNRLVKRRVAAAPEYTYDASGNLTFDPSIGNMRYDHRHRLVRIERTDGDIIEYDYDHNDRRIRTRVTENDVARIRHEIEGIWIQEGTVTTKVVIDDDQKLAVIPSVGDTLLHHLDRLGNVNVVTNLHTGAYVGQDEYTPYGKLSFSMVIHPHFSFQGVEFRDGLDFGLLGARHYCPRLGRFLTPDRYLIEKQEKIPGLLTALNMYAYVYCNPTNGIDPTGNIAFLVVLFIAVVVGAVVGALGAAVNGANTPGEWFLWILGGAIGGALVAITGGGAIGWIAMLFGASFTTAAIIGVAVWAGVSLLLGWWLPKVLDETNSEVAWFFSFLIKWIQSPLLTTLGLVVAFFYGVTGSNVELRRGMLFVGDGNGALTLGGIAWTTNLGGGGRVTDALARHEAYHGRTVATIGELGFYFTYLTVGAIWGEAEGGDWNDLNGMGCGNPFEKTAHVETNPATPSC
jgi:RHS repeat-associated protein